MIRRGTVFAAVGIMLSISAAHASDRWICKFGFENDRNPDHLFEGPVSVEGLKLLVYSGDFTSRPNPYEIVEDTSAGVIAIWHQPTQITVAIVDRRTMSFKMHLLSVSGSYEERWSGTCRDDH